MIREGVVVVAKVFLPFGNSVFLLSLPALSFRSISLHKYPLLFFHALSMSC